MDKLWQEILRLKNSKLDIAEFYKLQRKLGIETMNEKGPFEKKGKSKNPENSGRGPSGGKESDNISFKFA